MVSKKTVPPNPGYLPLRDSSVARVRTCEAFSFAEIRACGKPATQVYRVQRYGAEWSGEVPRCDDHAVHYEEAMAGRTIQRRAMSDLDGVPWPFPITTREGEDR